MASRFILAFLLLGITFVTADQSIALTRKVLPPLASNGVVLRPNLLQTVEYTKQKYHATLLNFQRNKGFPLPGTPELDLNRGASGNSKRDSSVPLTPLSGSALWSGAIQVGGQNFRIDFDTGSADLWIPSVNCTSAACTCSTSATCDVKDKFDCTKSKTCIPYPTKTFSISYVDGSGVRGNQYNDTVTLGGISATNTTFSAVDTMDTTLDNDDVDGIMGMGYRAISNLKQNPVFQNLYARQPRSFKSNAFSFFFSDADQGSELYLGGYNTSKTAGAPYYYPVTQKAYWQIGGAKAIANNINTTASGLSAIIDTGTTLIYAPNATVAKIFAPVAGAKYWMEGYWTFPCNAVPTIGWSFSNGPAFTMSAASLNLGRTSYTSNDCVASIVGQSIAGNAILMGDAFLKNVVSVFSLASNQVGFAYIATPKPKPTATLALTRGSQTAAAKSSSSPTLGLTRHAASAPKRLLL